MTSPALDVFLSCSRNCLGDRDSGLINIRIDPSLDPLRGDPRFDAIVKKMNFPA